MAWCIRILFSSLLIISLVSGSSAAFAKESVFDKFEEVRAHDGPQMLGAAERAVYEMNVEEGSVFALMLEDELKRRWLDINASFLQYDVQQIMHNAFEQKFDAAKLENVLDYNVKSLIREVLGSGYTIEEKDGHFYPWPDYSYLLRAFDNKMSSEVSAYFELCLADTQDAKAGAGDIYSEYERKASIIAMAEKYLQDYPDAYRKAAVSALYRTRLSEYLVKASNFSLDERLSEDIVKSYQSCAEKYAGTRLGVLSGEVAAAWQQQGCVYNDEMISLLAVIDKRIDLAANERVKGIYFNSNGLDLFKPQGQKNYMLLAGQVAPIYKAQLHFADTSGFVVLELKGITEKTLPADVHNVKYPQTFAVRSVLGASAWNLDSNLFAADFIAFNKNPAWNLRILTNDEVIFSSSSSSQPIIFPYQPPAIETKDGQESYLYTLQNNASSMTVIIYKQRTRDALAGVDYDYKAVVTLNGKKYEGMAFKQGEFPSGKDALETAR